LTAARQHLYRIDVADFVASQRDVSSSGVGIMRNSGWLLSAIVFGFGSMGVGHAATLFVPGSTFEVQGTNSPDTFTDTVNLAPGTYSLDNGALNLTISFMPAGGTDEWLVFNYAVTSGTLSSVSEDWSLYQTGLDAAIPINFIRAYSEALINGVAQPWTSSIFGGYSPMSSPIPGWTGTGAGTALFVDPISPGPIGQLGAFISPFGFLNDTGVNAAAVTGWTEALEFQSQTPVPEPSTWAMMLAGFVGLGFLGYRQTARTRTAA
jgi:hypothetical protein